MQTYKLCLTNISIFELSISIKGLTRAGEGKEREDYVTHLSRYLDYTLLKGVNNRCQQQTEDNHPDHSNHNKQSNPMYYSQPSHNAHHNCYCKFIVTNVFRIIIMSIKVFRIIKNNQTVLLL